jgi:hypothetical protein
MDPLNVREIEWALESEEGRNGISLPATAPSWRRGEALK